MSILFTLPKAVAVDSGGTPYPGALANFYLTGTTTRTDTYTTSALSVAHNNPVVADAAGVFPAIYLDPSITYKLVLTQSDATAIYTVDPIMSRLPDLDTPNSFSATQTYTKAGTTAAPSSHWNTTRATLRFTETDAAADNQIWTIDVTGGVMNFNIANDAIAALSTCIQIARSGTTCSEIEFNATVFDMNGVIDTDQTVALGGGAAPTLGTIGGSGPATAGQSKWIKIKVNGVDNWIPAWV